VITDEVLDGYIGTLVKKHMPSIQMKIHLVVCYHCDVLMGIKNEFFSMPLEIAVHITDCLKCGGENTRIMFTINYEGNETHE